MKKLCLFVMLLCSSLFGHSEQLVVGLSGNAYVTCRQDGAEITEQGIEHWTNPETVISVYFYLQQPTAADVLLRAKGNSEIKVGYGNESFKVRLQSDDFVEVPVGKINIPQAGYVRIDLQGISKSGESFGVVKDLLIDNVTCKSN